MNNSDYDTKYIKVLDGIRALAIMIIVWFHFWQQSWLGLTIGSISFEFIPRYGSLLVDMMILLSGFCLFIPYARKMVYNEPMPSTRDFYIKRIARIFPSYYLSLIIAFIFVLIFKNDWFNSFFIKDTIMHIFFVHNWSTDTLLCSNYLGTLWTVAIEMQFYLLFPFIAKRFVKKPVLTYLVMMMLGLLGIFYVEKVVNNQNIGFYVNHFLTFIVVYANGILASWFYISYTKGKKRTQVNDLFFTILAILSVMIYVYLCNSMGDINIQLWQIKNRLLLSFLFMLFVISSLLAGRLYQKLFNNKVMKFVAIISFNLYIYHQFIAVKLKEFRIPYYSGNVAPNFLGETAWQWKYTIICIIVSVFVAVFFTYFVEKPMSKIIKKKFKCHDS